MLGSRLKSEQRSCGAVVTAHAALISLQAGGGDREVHRALEQLLMGNGSHNQADADYWLVTGNEEADAVPPEGGARRRELSPPQVKAKQGQQGVQQHARHRAPGKVASLPSPLNRTACAHDENDATSSAPETPIGKAKKKKGLLSKIVSWGGSNFGTGRHVCEESIILGEEAEGRGKRPLMVSARNGVGAMR